jgi:hypothetical protein
VKHLLRYLLLTALMLGPQTALQAADTVNRPNTVITSPNGKRAVTAGMDESGAFAYAFEANGRKLISPSKLGLDFGPAGRPSASTAARPRSRTAKLSSPTVSSVPNWTSCSPTAGARR